MTSFFNVAITAGGSFPASAARVLGVPGRNALITATARLRG